MPIEPMLTEETPASALVARVLEEAGIEMVFGISGGHTGRIVSGLSKYQNSIRTVLVREESLGGVMAEVYGRLTRRPGVLARAGTMGAGQRADRHDRGAFVELADAAVDRFQRRPAVHPACALSAGDRGLGQLGRAPRLWRRHQACHAGARPDRRGAGDPARHQACALRSAGPGCDPLQPRFAGRDGCPGFATHAVPDRPLSAHTCRRRPSRGRSRPPPRHCSPRKGRC